MELTTLLHRQVHPHWLKDGHVMSIAFRPFLRDDKLLSVYDGDQITPNAAWIHYTNKLALESGGVWSVTVDEVCKAKMRARHDPVENFPEHAVIDFKGHNDRQIKANSKILAAKAEERGCSFGPK